MAFESLPSSGAGSATVGRVVRASWGELVRLNFEDHEDRLGDLEAASGISFEGEWDADTSYQAGDVVAHNGQLWRASVAIPAASPADEPGVSPSDWVLFLGTATPVITETIGITIDGGGSTISTGLKGYRRVAYSGTIVGWTLMATDSGSSPASGSIVIDVLKGAFASFPPTSSIAASAKPTLTNDQEAEDTTLSGWTTTVTAGDVFGFEVESASGVSRVTLQLDIETG